MSMGFDVQFIGATVGSGTSKEGKPFDMAYLEYAVAAKDFSNDRCRINKAGFESKKIDIDPSLINQLKDYPLGAKLKLVMTPNPENPSRNIVSQVQPAVVARKAAATA